MVLCLSHLLAAIKQISLILSLPMAGKQQNMVARWLILAVALLVFMVQVSSDADIEDHHTQVVKGGNRRLLPILDCGGLCKTRCRLHSRPKICIRACGTCCVRCKCVPPGTWGNRELCGTCYTNMTTHRNKTKCP